MAELSDQHTHEEQVIQGGFVETRHECADSVQDGNFMDFLLL